MLSKDKFLTLLVQKFNIGDNSLYMTALLIIPIITGGERRG